MLHRSRLLPAVIAAVLGLFSVTAAAAPRVVASIPPVHSLVAGVMQGVAEPRLMVAAGASPHAYSLRPSDAAALAAADAVFWIGPGLETFLTDPLAAIADEARVVALHAATGVRLLPYRSGLNRNAHGGRHDKGAGAAGHHRAGAMDMHVWLDPDNARAMVNAVVATLSAVDPGNAAAYAAGGKRLKARIRALDAELRKTLAPVHERPYVVFHDAYQYFERHYGLSPVGAVVVSPERRPGARHLVEIRRRIENVGVECVFAEPQFNADLVRTVTRDTGTRHGILDPLGTGLEPGADLYFRLMRNMAENLRDCLTAR